MIPLISNIFGAIKELFGFGSKRMDLNNAPEMQKRDEAQKENSQDDEDSKNIRERNLDAVRRSAS